MDGFMSLSESVSPLFLAWLACWTSALWFAMRRNGAKNDARRFRYCARCGFDIAARMSGRGAVPQARRVSTVVDAPRAAASGVLPSALLKSGWSRVVQPAADANGRRVMSDSPEARYFTICGAMNRAFDPGSRRWECFLRELQATLKERYGKVSIQKFNRGATQETVVAVVQEVERRAGL